MDVTITFSLTDRDYDDFLVYIQRTSTPHDSVASHIERMCRQQFESLLAGIRAWQYTEVPIAALKAALDAATPPTKTTILDLLNLEEDARGRIYPKLPITP